MRSGAVIDIRCLLFGNRICAKFFLKKKNSSSELCLCQGKDMSSTFASLLQPASPQ